jgi:hypothetical protein
MSEKLLSWQIYMKYPHNHIDPYAEEKALFCGLIGLALEIHLKLRVNLHKTK